MHHLDSTATLAGFFAAHAVWSLAEGEQLTPLYAWLAEGTLRELKRVEGETLEESVRTGQQWLAENPEAAKEAVLIYDGYMTTASGKLHAIIIEARNYQEPAGEFTMAIPYRAAKHAKGFAVHRPKFVDLADAADVVLGLSTAFFKGVNEHRLGAPVWKQHLDDSV